MTTDGIHNDAAGSRGPLDGAAYPLIHEAVARQARLRPEATAIVFRDDRISYRTVDAAADHYAAQLAAQGVGPGSVVPVHLPRSAHMLTALLAILKCGAAYAAFDYRWPADRVGALLDQLRPPVFISDKRPADATQAVWQPPAEPLETTAGRGGSVPLPDLQPGAPACVFFTSGTTGTPKGVVSPHEATTRLFGEGGLPGFWLGSVCAQSVPCAWDAFNLELWGMLTTGGTTVVVEEDYLLPGALRDIVKSAGVDTAFLTASLFNLFVDMDIDCFAGMRQVYAGGERLSPVHIRRFLERHPDIGLFNGYGPVESCVFATAHPIRLEDCDIAGGIPIGSPVAGTAIHIHDGDGICAPGVEGEVCIAGAGLAVEYLGQPELTAEKFAEITVDGSPVRVYHTGDLGFRDGDGVVHFRGRADRQVKVRGYRIEPGEIENAAMNIDGVRLCTVVPVPGQDTIWARLALFYTATLPDGVSGEGSDDPLELGRKLGENLPTYLVPDTILRVERFPVGPNGKIDNKALLAMLP